MMTTQDTIRRALKLMLVLSVWTIGGAYVYERTFLENAIQTTGMITAFKKKDFSSAQGDSIEMEISFSIEGHQRIFYRSRNVIEAVMGTYKPGDTVPVVYNAGTYPYEKIGYPQHLYRITLVFAVLWMLFCAGLIIAWYKTSHNKPTPPSPKSRRG